MDTATRAEAQAEAWDEAVAGEEVKARGGYKVSEGAGGLDRRPAVRHRYRNRTTPAGKHKC